MKGLSSITESQVVLWDWLCWKYEKNWARKYNTTTESDNCFVKIKRTVGTSTVTVSLPITYYFFEQIFFLIFTSRIIQHPEIFCAVACAIFQFNLHLHMYVRTYGTLRQICKQLTSNNIICMISQQLFQIVNGH